MKKISKKVIFFGSGPVAAASLSSLAHNFEIEYVVTKHIPPHHKGIAPVYELAQELGLSVILASTSKEVFDSLAETSFKSQLGVIVDYGVLLSNVVIDLFPLGIINSHFSLLPQWRGADPITFTVLSGQKETGVSLMLVVERLDEGQLIAQEKMAVGPTTTTPELTEQLVGKSNHMLQNYLPDYLSGRIQPFEQPDQPVSYSRKLIKTDGIIDWTKPAVQLERGVRAYAEWPKSRTTLAGKDVIITSSHVVAGTGTPGKASFVDKALVIACGDQALAIDKLKPAGKQEMTGQDFVAGYGQLL